MAKKTPEELRAVMREFFIQYVNNNDNASYQQKIKMDNNTLTFLLVEPANKIYANKQAKHKLIKFYEAALKGFDLSEIAWDNVIESSKIDVDEILTLAFTNLLLTDKYSKNNRLNISPRTLERLIFDEWVFYDKVTGNTEKFYVPKFNNYVLEDIDLSEINFDYVVLDVKDFFKKYVAHQEKYFPLVMPDGYMIFDEDGNPILNVNNLYEEQSDEEVFDVFNPNLDDESEDDEFSDDMDEEDDMYYDDFTGDHNEELLNRYQGYNLINGIPSYEPEELDPPELVGYTEEEMGVLGGDYHIDLTDTNANINFKTNKFGKFYDVDFSGTDLSNSKLEECDGIEMEYCTLLGSNAKLPNDRSNINNCSFERGL